MRTWKEASKVAWQDQGTGPNGFPGDGPVQIGCLQRIADACEIMAQDHARLIRDRDWYKMRYEGEQACVAKLTRSNVALRGCLRAAKAVNR